MVFIWYLLRFCLMTVALVVLVLGLYITLANAGLIRIPTYERSRIEASEEELREGRKDVAGLLPDTCLYGIYDSKGEYLEVIFPKDCRKRLGRSRRTTATPEDSTIPFI